VDEDPRSFEQKLAAALEHPLSETRARICWILGQKKASWAIPALVRMLGDNDLFVRVAALRALGEIGDPSAMPALERALDDENVMVRRAAQRAWQQVRSQQSV
jgi:HEAT repeat protein